MKLDDIKNYNYQGIARGIVEDLNNNNLWDTGNYLKRVKPEPVYYFPSELEVRANWDLNETFDLNIKLSVNDSVN